MKIFFLKSCLFENNFILLLSQNPQASLGCSNRGSFYFYDIMGVQYEKKFSCSSDIVALLSSRGLAIDDIKFAEKYIDRVGYYRLSGYLYPLLKFPKENHSFKPGSKFKNAINLYRFDKKFRFLIFYEIEKIEISFRSALSNIVSEYTGNIFWMTDPSYFANEERFSRTMALIDKEIKNSKEEFILHFKSKYSNPYPPSWILIEILPLGVVTRIFENLADNVIRKKIASRFGLPVPVFESWMTIVTLTRNSCCHHSRVWNKENAICPMIPKKIKGRWINSQISPKRIYFDLCIIKWFVDIISPHNNMKNRLLKLFLNFPMIDIRAMGFPKDWETEPLWM